MVEVESRIIEFREAGVRYVLHAQKRTSALSASVTVCTTKHYLLIDIE
jgi:hypothetical protein